MIDKNNPLGTYVVEVVGRRCWMLVFKDGSKLMYSIGAQPPRPLDDIEDNIVIHHKINHGNLIVNPRIALEWQDGNLIRYREEASSTSWFRSIWEFYKPVADRLNDLGRLKK